MDNMEAYGEFAKVYDIFQDNIHYEEWADYLCERLKEYGIENGLVLELGCGTGTMTELLAEAGYDMIGVDNSEEMLAEAMEKKEQSCHDILYLLQDMQEFELYSGECLRQPELYYRRRGTGTCFFSGKQLSGSGRNLYI